MQVSDAGIEIRHSYPHTMHSTHVCS
jgi:hypothetical protein